MTAGDVPPTTGSAPPGADRSLAQLLGDLTDETRTLFRQELALAKAEVKQDATAAAKAGGKLAAAGLVGFMAWLLLSFGAVWALAEVVDPWAGFLIVGAVYGLIAAVLALSGRNQIQQVSPAPERAVDEAKETKQWLQDRT